MTIQTHQVPSMSTLDWVESALRSYAVGLELTVQTAPQLASTVFRGGDAHTAAKLEPSELPNVVRAVHIGRYAILLGLLPEVASAEAVNETLRRYRNQCVIARSYLTPNEALDLQLFLVGPRGSERKSDWQPLALVIERDDRVARKLVWLRPSEPEAEEASFADFIKRTFLARPWQHDAMFTMAALDNLNRAAAIGEVPRDTVGEWVQLALTRREDPLSLVEGLVDAWAKRGQE